MGSSARISYPLVWGIVFALLASLLLGWIAIARTQVASTPQTPTELNLKAWEQAAKDNPLDSATQMRLGFAYYRVAQGTQDPKEKQALLVKALASYDASIKLNSKIQTSQYNRAIVLRELGRTDEALKGFEKMIKENKGKTQATHDAGMIYFEKGDMKKAVDRLEKAVQAEPMASDYRLDLAKAYVKAGKNRQAITQLTFALKMSPDNNEVRSMLTTLTASTKKSGGK